MPSKTGIGNKDHHSNITVDHKYLFLILINSKKPTNYLFSHDSLLNLDFAV